MTCYDPLALAFVLARWLMSLLAGAEIGIVLQAIRSAIVHCVEGPLG